MAHGNQKHGMFGTRIYRTWAGMHQRCRNPKAIGYERYGGRGIRVCTRWFSFENFLADMGRSPGVGWSIDRKDPNGDYEPGNCRWATTEQQAANKRSNILVTLGGVTKPLGVWARETGLPGSTVYNRVHLLG